ncbi:MAG: HAMP domain-containing protein [Alphaproteobacteria bacterium]|nr:HAMP domain-containing protein [Alphaproteobacteria bacterium]
MSTTGKWATSVSRLKVPQRIYSGFLIVLSLIAFLGIQSLAHLLEIDRELSEVVGTGSKALATAQLVEMSERMGREIFNYIGTQTEQTLGEAKGEIDHFSSTLDELSTSMSRENQSSLAEIMAAASNYRLVFDEVVSAVKKRRDGMGQTALVGAEMNTTAMAVLDAAFNTGDVALSQAASHLQQALQAARMSTARYLSTNDPNDAGAAQSELAKFKEEVEAMKALAPSARMKRFLASLDPANEKFSAGLADAYEGNRSLAVAKTKTAEAVSRLTNSVYAFRNTFLEIQKSAQESMVSSVDVSQTQAVITPIVAILLGVCFAWLIGASITGPILAMTVAMSDLAEGDTSVEIPAIGNRDEIGDMARAVQVFKDNAIKMDQMRDEQDRERHRAEEEKRRDRSRLAADFNTTVKLVVEDVTREVRSVQSHAQTLSSIAEAARAQAMQVASASEQASACVGMVAAATEELTSTGGEITSKVTESARIASDAVGEARNTSKIVNRLIEAADRIGSVVKLIHGIASQTNLLALNATIEAARAGDAGRGFAVVANEVKVLANQTTSATNDIGSQVDAIQEATQGVVHAIRTIGGVVERIDTIVADIAASVGQQAEATREIACNAQQAATGTTDISRTITDVSAQVTDARTFADTLLQNASSLSNQTVFLNEKVDTFMEHIRAS